MERNTNNITRLFALAAFTAVFASAFSQANFSSSLALQGGPGGQRGQGGPGGPGGPGGRMMEPQGPMLLMHPDVQKELKLSQQQIQQLQQMFPRPQGGPGGRGGPGGPGGRQDGQRGGPGGPEGRPDPKEMDAKLKKVLSEAQFTRFQQIDLQVAGPRAFMSPRLVEALSISEDQRDEIREVMEANRPQPGQQMGDPESQKSRVLELVLSKLSGEQRAKYKVLIGTPFRLTRPQGGPGGPGGRGGQGGPGTPPPFTN